MRSVARWESVPPGKSSSLSPSSSSSNELRITLANLDSSSGPAWIHTDGTRMPRPVSKSKQASLTTITTVSSHVLRFIQPRYSSSHLSTIFSYRFESRHTPHRWPLRSVSTRVLFELILPPFSLHRILFLFHSFAHSPRYVVPFRIGLHRVP